MMKKIMTEENRTTAGWHYLVARKIVKPISRTQMRARKQKCIFFAL